MSQGFTPSQSTQNASMGQEVLPPGPSYVPEAGGRGAGGAMFGAVLMVIGGLFGALQGFAYVIKGSFYVKPAHYWVATNATAWGWWHLVLGILVVVAGVGIIASGAAWARWAGVVLVGIQALSNFTFIPVAPFWSLALIAIDLWIIHSLVVYRPERY